MAANTDKRTTIIPALAGWTTALAMDTEVFEEPIIAWRITEETINGRDIAFTDPITSGGLADDCQGVKYPDGRVYAFDRWFDNAADFLKGVNEMDARPA